MCISTTAFRRDLFDQVGGFDPRVGSIFDVDLFFRICQASGLPVRTLGESGGRYYPLRGSTWTRQYRSGEGTELFLNWIHLRERDVGSETIQRVTRALARRARMAARASLLEGNSEAAVRNFAVAIECSTGHERLKNQVGRAVALLPAPIARNAQRAYASVQSARSQRVRGNAIR